MRPVLLLLPVAVLAMSAPVAGLLARRSPGAARTVAIVAAWGAVAVNLALWLPTRSALDIDLGDLGAGIRLAIRLDAVSFAFSLFAVLPAALLLTFARLRAPGAAIFALAAGVLAIDAGGLVLASLAVAVTVGALALMLQGAEGGIQTGSRIRSEAAVLALLWAATTLYAVAGTDQFAFIPTAAFGAPVFALVAAASLLLAGVVPWRPWTVRFFERFPAATAALAVSLLVPIGFSLLLRMYEAGGGHYPDRAFNFGLGALGALVALTAALRAQAAPTVRQYLAEAVPAAAGFALLALALGTPLGIAAAVGILACGALLAPLPALLPSAGGGIVVVLALAAGLPPTLVFATRLIVIEAAVTANEVFAYAAVVAALAWLLGFAGAARALRLPAAAENPGSAVGTGVVAALLAAGGVLLGAFQLTIGNPAAVAVMPASATAGGSAVLGGLIGNDTAAGSWPAVGLGLPVLLLLVLVAFFGRRSVVRLAGAGEETVQAAIEPSWRGWPDRVGGVADSFEIPDEFRVTGWENLDRAMATSSVWFWVASFGVLAVLLLR